jgi:hypothetical protein
MLGRPLGPPSPSPGTAASSCRPVSTAPGAMEMVPPRAKTAIRAAGGDEVVIEPIA